MDDSDDKTNVGMPAYQAKRIREMLPALPSGVDHLTYIQFPGCDPDHGEAGGCCEDFRYQ